MYYWWKSWMNELCSEKDREVLLKQTNKWSCRMRKNKDAWQFSRQRRYSRAINAQRGLEMPAVLGGKITVRFTAFPAFRRFECLHGHLYVEWLSWSLGFGNLLNHINSKNSAVFRETSSCTPSCSWMYGLCLVLFIQQATRWELEAETISERDRKTKWAETVV